MIIIDRLRKRIKELESEQKILQSKELKSRIEYMKQKLSDYEFEQNRRS